MPHTNHIIESARLYCRLFTMNDLEGFHGLNGNEEVMKYIRPVITLEQSEEKLRNSIEEYTSRPELLRYAVAEKESGLFVGCFFIFPLDEAGEKGMQVGYSFLPQYWGRGYATEITAAGIAYVFNEMKYPEIFAVTHSKHHASQQVLLKNGFKLVKEFTEDEAILHLYKNENS